MSDQNHAVAIYDVPALDGNGQPVTMRLRPDLALVTLEIVRPDETSSGYCQTSITFAELFLRGFTACARQAAVWGKPQSSDGETPTGGVS